MIARDEVDTFITEMAAHTCGFYRAHWGGENLLEKLPPMTRDILRKTPLPQRRYTDESGLVKIVRDAEGAFLSEWGFPAIAAEGYGMASKRPMVYLSNPHEVLEKAAWCNLRGMPALIGERTASVAILQAERWKIDSLITDPVFLIHLRPFLEQHRLDSLSILSDSFDTSALAWAQALADDVRLVYCLPETGALAEAQMDQYPRFRPLHDVFVEANGGEWVVTKTRLLATPIIRYRVSSCGTLIV